MKLITKEIQRKLPTLAETEELTADEQTVWLKLFGGAACNWWITCMNDDGTMFGLCDLGLGSPELGYVNIQELEEIKFPPFGLGVERDLYWKPITLREVMAKAGL